MARGKASDKRGRKAKKGTRKTKVGVPGRGSKRRNPKDLVNYKQMRALSHPVRIRVLAILVERVASPKEISKELNESLSGISYHVSVLRECGFIKEKHTAKRRGALAHFYEAAVPTLIPPKSWDNLPASLRKGISACILQEFFDDASASMEAGVFEDPPGELSWTPLVVDADGVEEVGRLARDFLKSVLEVQANANKRLSKGKGDGATSATVFLASFLSARSPEEGKKASATKRR